MREKWIRHKKYTDYEVSSFGRIRRNGAIVRPYVRGLGYNAIYLRKKNHSKVFYVHRLVCEIFGVEIKNKEVNHKNGIKSDNRISNLESCTGIENMIHARKNGLWNCSGEKNPASKLKKYEVIRIRKLLKKGKTHLELSKIFKVSKATISCINTNTRWQTT
jgi:HNH endonuclease